MMAYGHGQVNIINVGSNIFTHLMCQGAKSPTKDRVFQLLL